MKEISSNHPAKWPWLMAWRDSRASRRRLLVFVTSIVMGVAALVGMTSLGRNLRSVIEDQSKTLLGADLVIRSPRPWNPEAEALLQSIEGQQSRETSFLSMISIPGRVVTRLAQIRALEGEFPYYGEIETEPVPASRSFLQGATALVENSLMLQLGLQVGESVRVGSYEYRIAGRLRKVPGESVSASMLGARIYIPMKYLSQTRLLQTGSLASYRAYFKLQAGVKPEEVQHRIEPLLAKLQLDSETVEERKAQLGQAMQNLYHFLNLVGFVALLLGGVGVASAIHAHIRQKLTTVAVLRCLGARVGQTVRIYLVQASFLGLIGASVGALLGIGVQWMLPSLLREFLPVTIPFSISWLAVVEGVVVGATVTIFFALLPLLSIRRVSPLLALRSSFESHPPGRSDPYRWLICLLLILGMVAFATTQTRQWRQGIAFSMMVLLSFAFLGLVAKVIMSSARKFLPRTWPYVWRQGLANLYRPNNQTLVLVLSLGLGCFLVTTLYAVHHLLLSQISRPGSSDRPNMILFDIQSDQRAGVVQLIESLGAPVLQQIPIVTMRLSKVKDQTAEELLQDPKHSITEWMLRREYRCTYRESLLDTERVVAGGWQGRADTHTQPTVSLEDKLAQRLGVRAGDRLEFDVQGVPLPVTVGSLRKVDWAKLTPNFFIVFPTGVLEGAPQTHVLVTRVVSSETSARLQQAVVGQFPNVSVVDLELVLSTLDSILDKVSFVIRFMAMFSIVTGLTVLVGAVLTGRYQRVQESVLLKTLGASRKQVLRILMVEYLFLGVFSSMAGLLLSVTATWALARFLFKAPFAMGPLPTAGVLLGVVLLTLLTGMLSSRGVHNRPPLEVLRSDT